MAQSHGLLDQVDSLIEHAKQAPISLPNGDGDFIQSQLVRYGCLLTCAAIEQAIVDSATSYARRVGDERLGGFISEMLRTGRNPWPSYIRAVFGKFDSTWGAHIGEYIADNVGDHNVNSIVSNRNRIAHGGRSRWVWPLSFNGRPRPESFVWKLRGLQRLFVRKGERGLGGGVRVD
jgi:hypothetical protein